MQEIVSSYVDDPEVAVVAIQTTFEGFSINSAQVLHEVAAKYDLSIPIGHNGWAGKPSPLMYKYKTRGTPWIVIIDKSGMIRFSNFFLKPNESRKIIEELKRE